MVGPKNVYRKKYSIWKRHVVQAPLFGREQPPMSKQPPMPNGEEPTLYLEHFGHRNGVKWNPAHIYVRAKLHFLSGSITHHW